MMDRIGVLLVDDHSVVRQGLRRILEADDEIEVVGEARDGRSAVEMAQRLKPAACSTSTPSGSSAAAAAPRWA